MIVEERLTTYLHSLESADIPVLDEIEQEALADMVPIIRKETKKFSESNAGDQTSGKDS